MFRFIFCGSFVASWLLMASASGQHMSSSSSDSIALANKYFALAEQFHWQAEFDTSFKCYLKAYEIYKTFELDNDDINLARKYFIKGYICREEARYDSSNFYFENASSFYKTMAERSDDAKMWADHLHCFNEMGRNPPPKGARTLLEPLQRSLQVVLKHIDENHKSVAFSYFLIANAYSILGDPDKALLYWQKSLRVWKQLGLEKSPYVSLNYLNIGVMYARSEDYEKAVLFFKNALAIVIEALGENHFWAAMFYNYIGNAYDNKGDAEKALEYYSKSLQVQRNLGDTVLSSPFSNSNIGSVYAFKGEYEKALDYFQEAIRKWTEEHGEDNIELAKGYDLSATALSLLSQSPKATLKLLKLRSPNRSTYKSPH